MDIDSKELYISVNADSEFVNWSLKSKIDTINYKNSKWARYKNRVRNRININSINYIKHPNLDIGVFLLEIPRQGRIEDIDGNVCTKFSKVLIIPRSMIKLRSELSLGDETYFIGFPFGLGVKETIEPLVRSGSIAWISPSDDEFLLDSFSFGGNSGSPIFLKQIFGKVPGESKWENAYLIGMITGHHGLKVENILSQPNPSELKFEKGNIDLNLGLARCVWIDDILSVVEDLQKISQ